MPLNGFGKFSLGEFRIKNRKHFYLAYPPGTDRGASSEILSQSLKLMKTLTIPELIAIMSSVAYLRWIISHSSLKTEVSICRPVHSGFLYGMIAVCLVVQVGLMGRVRTLGPALLIIAFYHVFRWSRYGCFSITESRIKFFVGCFQHGFGCLRLYCGIRDFSTGLLAHHSG